MTSGLNRRNVLGGATAAAVGLPLLAACGSDDPESATDPGSGASSSSPTEDGSEPTGGGAAGALAATNDIPVGGGLVVDDVVVTQPAAGEFRAFSAICTHQGCTVGTISDNVITCPCHRSTFSAEDGTNIAGPLPEQTPNSLRALGEVAITVEGDSITLA